MSDRKKAKQEALRRARLWHAEQKRAADKASKPRIIMSKIERHEARAKAKSWAEKLHKSIAISGEANIEVVAVELKRKGSSEYNNATDLIKFGIVFQSIGRRIYSDLKSRPDGDITSKYNHINWENDERGHVSYPALNDSQRMKDINNRRPKERGKIWIRQQPVTLRDGYSSVQTTQNKHVASWIKYYITSDLGQREDNDGGRRVIVFIGFRRDNKHVIEARKEKLIGYWDEVRIIDSTEESTKQLLMLLMNSHDKILSHHADSSYSIGYWDDVRIIDSTEESAIQLRLLMDSHDKILSHHADSSCVAKSIEVIAADRQERLTLDTSGYDGDVSEFDDEGDDDSSLSSCEAACSSRELPEDERQRSLLSLSNSILRFLFKSPNDLT